MTEPDDDKLPPEFAARMALADDLADTIRPLLVGVEPDVIGMALAMLVARFIAGHHPEIRHAQDALITDLIHKMVPVEVAGMIERGGLPEDWDKEPTEQ